MRYRVTISAEFADEMETARAADRRRIRKALGALERQAEVAAKHRKKLDLARLGRPPSFEHQPPVWQLSVGQWRVFYDVSGHDVIVRAMRFKPPHKTTEEVL